MNELLIALIKTLPATEIDDIVNTAFERRNQLAIEHMENIRAAIDAAIADGFHVNLYQRVSPDMQNVYIENESYNIGVF